LSRWICGHFQVKRSTVNSGNSQISGLDLAKARLDGYPVVIRIHNKSDLLFAPRTSEEDVKKLRDLITDSSRHLDDPSHLKRNNLDFHLLLAKASGNPVLSILLESVFEILVELSLDFLDLSLEKHFFQVHKKIFQVIKKNGQRMPRGS